MQEVTWFLKNRPPLYIGDIVALDMEKSGNMDSAEWAYKWLQMVESAIGYKPILYSYLSYIQTYLQDKRLAQYPLWLADYGKLPAKVPPWDSVAIWQYTETSSVPGFRYPVDESELARNLDGLKKLGKLHV